MKALTKFAIAYLVRHSFLALPYVRREGADTVFAENCHVKPVKILPFVLRALNLHAPSDRVMVKSGTNDSQ
jgi:hypothetical protein